MRVGIPSLLQTKCIAIKESGAPMMATIQKAVNPKPAIAPTMPAVAKTTPATTAMTMCALERRSITNNIPLLFSFILEIVITRRTG